jgi:hypothetical protein
MHGVYHDESVGRVFERGESKAPAEVWQVRSGLERFKECGVRLEVRCDAALLGANRFGIGFEKAAEDIDLHARHGGDEFPEGFLIGDLLGEEDIGLVLGE